MYINTCVHVLQYVNNFMILIAVMVNFKKISKYIILLIHVLRACISPLVKKHIYNVFDNLLEATLVLLLTEKKKM